MVVMLLGKEISAGYLLFERSNAGPQPLPKAGARHERTLEAVGCRPLLASPDYEKDCLPYRAFSR
jgi:hypothetical protein